MAKTEATIPLGIPDVRVLKSEAGERGEIIITIESTTGKPLKSFRRPKKFQAK
jgi:hypothetical protein